MSVRSVSADAWGGLPVVVISSADSSAADQTHHAALAAMSTRGKHVVAESGGHYVHYDDPDLVIEAILGMLRTRRHERRLGRCPRSLPRAPRRL